MAYTSSTPFFHYTSRLSFCCSNPCHSQLWHDVRCLMTARPHSQPPENAPFTLILMVLSYKILLERSYFVIFGVGSGPSVSFSKSVSSCCLVANVTTSLLSPYDNKNEPWPGSYTVTESVSMTLPRLCGGGLMECSDDLLVHTLWIDNSMYGGSHLFQR